MAGGIFGTKPPFLADVNLIMMVVILVLLIVGYFMQRQRRLKTHGYFMFAVTALNLISILLVMLPAFLVIVNEAHLSSFVPLAAFHHVLGLVVQLTGIYIVFVWRFRQPEASCFKAARLMKALFILWILAIIDGFFLYYQLYMT